jgi:excisionase family DNA binding protein
MEKNEPDTKSPFLTIPEVAAMLRLSRQSIERRVKTGEIPAVRTGRTGRSIRIDGRELQAWLYGRAS